MTEPADDFPMRRLLNAGRALMGEFDTETILRRLLESAREITGARYAALGVLNERRTGFERFLAAGIDDETHRAIGDPPQGRGVLGLLIEEPRPVRLRDIASHSRSYGFPTGHPAMRSFLGVPIMVRGKAWGNLYLTEKAGGEFTEIDVEDVTTLAGWAAIAIDNARQYETGERQRQELERALRGLRANRDVALAVGSDASLDHVLELVAKHGRALVNARSLLIMLHQGDELVVAAGAGDVENARRARLALSASRLGEILERGGPERLVGVAARLPFAPHELGVGDLHAVLVVPMLYRGRAVGLLAAFDHGEGRDAFSEDDEDVLRTFATSAATRVALMQSVEVERLRSSMAAAEAERGRWARELHDETLQSLCGLRLLLSGARRHSDPGDTELALGEAIACVEREIESLRAIIADLRPAVLDQLGLRAALEALLERQRESSGLEIEIRLELPDANAGEPAYVPELEVTVYRLVQEALTNVVKHAEARNVHVMVAAADGQIVVEVRDDGAGFDPDEQHAGYGLRGMHERVGVVGGRLTISSDIQGTLIRAAIPSSHKASLAISGRGRDAVSNKKEVRPLDVP
jgi:signal transduction histidine kinase